MVSLGAPLGVEPRVDTGAEVGEPVAKPLGVEPREETGAAVGLPVAETLGVEPMCREIIDKFPGQQCSVLSGP